MLSTTGSAMTGEPRPSDNAAAASNPVAVRRVVVSVCMFVFPPWALGSFFSLCRLPAIR